MRRHDIPIDGEARPHGVKRRMARGSRPPECRRRLARPRLRSHRRRAAGEARLARRGDARGRAVRERPAGADGAADGAAATFGESIVIAWNNSTETARTVALRHAFPRARQEGRGAERRRLAGAGAERRGDGGDAARGAASPRRRGTSPARPQHAGRDLSRRERRRPAPISWSRAPTPKAGCAR